MRRRMAWFGQPVLIEELRAVHEAGRRRAGQQLADAAAVRGADHEQRGQIEVMRRASSVATVALKR